MFIIKSCRQLLTTICGVVGSNKLCTRSIRCETLQHQTHVMSFHATVRCPAHTDVQRREVRLKWLRGRVDEDDGESDGETAALRESLQQLSNASSPAESVVSTSSNPGHSLGSSGASSRTGKREKRGRGKKGRPGSKNGSSRGSTPPLMK